MKNQDKAELGGFNHYNAHYGQKETRKDTCKKKEEKRNF